MLCSGPRRPSGLFFAQNIVLQVRKKHESCQPTATPHWVYRFPSEHRSQAVSGAVSTWMGDRLGTPGAVGSISFFPFYVATPASNRFVLSIRCVEDASTSCLNYCIKRKIRIYSNELSLRDNVRRKSARNSLKIAKHYESTDVFRNRSGPTVL